MHDPSSPLELQTISIFGASDQRGWAIEITGLVHTPAALGHDRRKILHFNVTRNPNALWVVQQWREAWATMGTTAAQLFPDKTISARIWGCLSAHKSLNPNNRAQDGSVWETAAVSPTPQLRPTRSAFCATTLATTFGRFGPSRHPLKHWGFLQIENWH
jgi:hypothetical protein